MIHLPPGCTVHYPIIIELVELTEEIVEWFKLVGGNTTVEEHYDHRGRKVSRPFVQYGLGKKSYYHADGTGHIRLQFQGRDAPVATMFILKFLDKIVNHNMKEYTSEYEES
jgi:hypothetical protein